MVAGAVLLALRVTEHCRRRLLPAPWFLVEAAALTVLVAVEGPVPAAGALYASAFFPIP